MAFTWSLAAPASTTNTLVIKKCIWAGAPLNRFVAVGNISGTIPTGTSLVWTSADGITWSLRTAAKGYTWTSVAFSPTLGSGSGRLVAVTSSIITGGAVSITDQVMYSDDGGVSWTSATSAERSAWNDIVWADGSINLFVAVSQTGTNRVQTSPDGINWTGQTAASAKTWSGIAWDGTTLVATAGTSGTASVMTSTNGTAWSGQTTVATTQFKNRGISYSATLGMFLALSNVSSVMKAWRSTDSGVTWTAWAGTPVGWTANNGTQCVWSPEAALWTITAGNGDDNVLTSPDGNTFTTVPLTDGIGGNFFRTWDALGYSPTLRKVALHDQTAHDTIAVGSSAAIPVNGITPSSGHLGGGYSLAITSAGDNGGFVNGAKVFIDWDMEGRTSGAFSHPFNATTDKVSSIHNVNEATNVVVVDANNLTCDAPIGLSIYSLGVAGSRTPDVLVINPDSTVPNIACYLPGGFTYLNPTLTSVLATSGPAGGGTVVTLTGTNLFGYGNANAVGGAANQTILFGGEPATSVTVNSSTSITCTTPPAVSATNPVDITFSGYAYSLVMFSLGGYSYLHDAASAATLPASFTFTFSWFLLDEIPAEFIADAQFDFGSARDDWADDFGLSVADYLATKYNRRKVNVPARVPIHWYTYSLYRPGLLWSLSSEPSHYGWFQSVDGYTGASSLIIGDAPHDPRSFTEIAAFATGGAAMLGGFPGTGVSFRNHFIYAAGGYSVGSASPTLRLFDGLSDREVMALPLTAAGVIPKAIMSMVLQGETIYLSTLDSGTSAADFAGRVFAFDPLAGALTQLGAAFSSGEVPYALCFHMGRLWCGTNKGSGAGGKVYYLRPGIDSTWTLDYTLSTSSIGGVCSLASYNGKLYVGSDNGAGSFAQVIVRDALGAYTTSTTATGGTATVNNGFLYLKVFNSNLYAAYWNPDTPAVAKIYKFDGSSWSTVYNGASGTLRPFIAMFESNKSLYAIGGGNSLTAVLLSSTNGTSWTDLTPQLTGVNGTAVPVFGEVII